MTTFKDLESLQLFLKQDAKRVSLNPVRFINVDSMAMWIEVKKFLLALADETLPLSKFCEGKDTTPNIKRVSAALKKVKKSQFVSPLSEYLRIIPEQAEPVIQKFIKADYQNNDNGKLRIYFLMYRMKSLLRTVPSDDPRAKDCIVLFETDEESDYKLTIIQKDLDVKLAGNEIDGFRSYLEYWEANPDKPLILHTGNAIHFEKNHFFDDVHVIVTSYDLIRYQYGLPASVFEELGTDNDWNNLVRVIIKEGSFEDACRSTLSINRYSSSLFERWNRYNSFQKWLLWLWSRQQSGKSYEIVAAKACKSSAEYLDNIYCCIIDYLRDDKFEQFYKDRKRILSVMQAVPTEHYWNELSSLNRIDALSCLTCLTDVEQKTIFEIVAEFSYQQRKSVLSKLIWNGDYYYVVGFSEKHKGIGSFRVDRIVRCPKILDDDAVQPPKNFDMNVYLNSMFRMYNGQRKQIELVCSNDVMDAIIDKFGKEVTVLANDMQSFRAIVNTAVGRVFYSWVFGFAGKVTIKSPEDVKKSYAIMVKQAAQALIE